MPYCDCGTRIQSGTRCRECNLHDDYGERLQDFDDYEAEDDEYGEFEEWSVEQQGLGGEAAQGQATLDGGIEKEESR